MNRPGSALRARLASGDMGITELRPHLYRLVLGRYQAYLWHDHDSVTLVDSGEAGSVPAIVAQLRQIGLVPGDVDRLVLTHFHDDHTGSAAEVSSWGEVQVIAHAADVPVIRGEVAGPPPNFTPFERELHARVAAGLACAPPARVDREVRDGDVLDFAGGAHVVSTPGHTDGSIALYLPGHKVLITGDIAAEYEGEVMLGVFNLDRAAAIASFCRIADLDVDTACFGHGEPLTENAASRLRQVAAALIDHRIALGPPLADRWWRLRGSVRQRFPEQGCGVLEGGSAAATSASLVPSGRRSHRWTPPPGLRWSCQPGRWVARWR